MNHVLGYVLALDMTARHIQDKLKKAGHPWLLAKGFDTSCPISDFIPKSQVADVNNLNLVLKVNDAIKQNGNTSDMIYKLPTLIAYISKYFKLEYGDLILTGTPSGVSPVKHGDIIEANLNDLAKIKFSVVELPPQWCFQVLNSDDTLFANRFLIKLKKEQFFILFIKIR